MRYIMKQKLFSLGHDFIVQNDQEKNIYRIENKILTLGGQATIKDMKEKEMVTIKQKVMSGHTIYNIFHHGECWASLKKEGILTVKNYFKLTFPNSKELEDISIQGDLLDHQYVFKRHDQKIVTVSRKWFSLVDTYGVDVPENETAILFLAATVVVDMACRSLPLPVN